MKCAPAGVEPFHRAEFGDDLLVLALLRQRHDSLEVCRGDHGRFEPFHLTLRELGGFQRLASLFGQAFGL